MLFGSINFPHKLDSPSRSRSIPFCLGRFTILSAGDLRLRISAMVIGALMFGSLVGAQQLPSRVRGSRDQNMALPASSRKPFGYAEPKALGELAAYKASTGGVGWSGLVATGRISYDGTEETLPAELSILPGNKVKLDVTKPGGHDITVYNGVRGSVAYAGAKKILITPAGATAGFAPFDLPYRAGGDESPNYSIVDQGLTTVDGSSLHRLSVEVPIAKKDLFPYEKEDRSIIDFYFDPTTHLLAKTASLIPVPGTNQRILLKVNSYSGYQRVGGHLIPTSISETINGQPVWQLVLDSFDSKKALSGKDFIF
jgi:hypothetical protein